MRMWTWRPGCGRFGVAVAAAAGLCVLHVAWMGTHLGGAAATRWADGIAELLSALLAAAACAVAARRGAGPCRRGWGLMAVSALVWGVGEAVDLSLELVVGREPGFPSGADAAFLLAVPPAVMAVIIFAGHNRLTWRLRSVVDGLISGTALLSLSWVTSLGAVYHATGRSTVAIAVGLAYPVSGVVIMTMLVVVVIRAPRRGRVPLLLLTSGLAAAAVADTAFAYQAATGGSSFGSIVDTGWVAGYLLIGLAALWAWERPVAPAAESPPPSFNRRLLPYLPVAVAMLIAVDEEIRGQQPHGFLFLILLTLVVLVLLRQVLTLRDNADLVRRIGVRERELEYRATHDALTDLINRGRFHARMTETLAQRMAGGGPPAAVLLLDIDGLTRVNTAHGTGTGDRLLVTVARRLTACVRPTDAVARVGSDEFAVLLPQVRGSEQLTEVAERILEAIAVPMDVHDGTSLHSTVSLGVAIAERLDLTADELLRRADVAVHAAMAAGEGLVGVFEPSLEVVLGRPHPRRSRAHRADDEDAVRLWLARELHDDALQKLTTMLIDMEEARREVPETLIGHRVLDFQTSVRSVIGGLRRLLGDLREQPGEDDRLVADLGTLLGQLEVRAGIKGQLSVSSTWPESLSAHIASQLRRIAEEALRNVALHSGAGRVTVSLDTEEERLTLTVSDNGHGCYWPDRRSTGSGMLGMEERALLLGGRLEVSSSPGAGTTVRGTFSAKSA